MLPVNPPASLFLILPTTIAFCIGTQPLPAQSSATFPPRADIRDRNGIVLATDSPAPDAGASAPSQRRYPYQALACHVLGFTNQPRSDSPALGNNGMEKVLNDELSPKSTPDGTPFKPGNSVYLTLDARHQSIVENVLIESKIGRSAAVLMEVNTGKILAMASMPTFDPNHYVPNISWQQFEDYRHNPAKPLINRAISNYTPGASFMLVTGLAAALCGHGQDAYSCDGVFQAGTRSIPCWIRSKGGSTHGMQTMDQAMENGCGLYFYGLTHTMGYDKIDRLVELTKLREKPGTGLQGEASGWIPAQPTQENLLTTSQVDTSQPWTEARAASISVGSGPVSISPLHMTTLAAAIANGGIIWKPSLVDRVGEDDSPSQRKAPPTKIVDLKNHGLSVDALAPLRSGMRKRTAKVVTNATPTVPLINGATGSMVEYRKHPGNPEQVREMITWYVCYAPADHPKWALTVLVQHGRTGAGVLAFRILDRVAALEDGKLQAPLRPIAPVPGHFDIVNFPTDAKAGM